MAYQDSIGDLAVREYSAEFKSTLASVSATESPLILLEISHVGLTEPIRVVNDSDNLESNGHLFVAAPFRCTLPDDYENQIPKARLSIDNVGRDLMYWIESSAGGKGATVRFMQVMRSRPDHIEWEITMNLNNVTATMAEVSGELGFDDFFSRAACRRRYDPYTAPGLF